MKSHKTTRQELYELVWQTPISKLAKEFGLSDRGLAKLCERNEIPLPPRGHWAKKAAGRPSPQTPLPQASNKLYSEKIVITEYQKTVTKPAAEVTEALSAVPSPEISVSMSLTKPHLVIQRWLDEREADIREDKRFASRHPTPGWSPMYKPFTELEQRRHRILDTVFKAIEKGGYQVKLGDRSFNWEASFDGITVEFDVKEREKMIKIPLTKKESLESWYQGKTHRTERQPSGHLMLIIRTHLPKGLKTRWAEDEIGRPLEELVSDIVKTLIAAGPVLVQQRKEQEERMRQYEAERHRIFLEQQRIQLDQECWDRFLRAVTRSSQAKEALAFIAEIKVLAAEQDSQAKIAGKSIQDWIEWAETKAKKHDPLHRGLSGLFEQVSKPKQGYGFLDEPDSDA